MGRFKGLAIFLISLALCTGCVGKVNKNNTLYKGLNAKETLIKSWNYFNKNIKSYHRTSIDYGENSRVLGKSTTISIIQNGLMNSKQVSYYNNSKKDGESASYSVDYNNKHANVYMDYDSKKLKYVALSAKDQKSLYEDNQEDFFGNMYKEKYYKIVSQSRKTQGDQLICTYRFIYHYFEKFKDGTSTEEGPNYYENVETIDSDGIIKKMEYYGYKDKAFTKKKSGYTVATFENLNDHFTIDFNSELGIIKSLNGKAASEVKNYYF